MQRCKHDAQATTCRLCYLEKNKNNKQQPTKIEKCIYLGKRVRNADGSVKTELCTEGCAKGTKLDIFECEVYGEITLTKCRRCPIKCLEKPKSTHNETKLVLPDKLKDLPKIGVVIGSQGWPGLMELQITLIRKMCWHLPILIAEDAPRKETPEILFLKKKYNEVDVWNNPRSFGHGAGDMSAFFKGIVWAKKNNIEYLVKISRRLLIESPFWIQYWTKRLIKDGLSVSLQVQRFYPWPIHTHLMILKVEDWFNKIEDILPFEYDTVKTSYNVEIHMGEIIKKNFGNKYSTLSLVSVSPDVRFPGITWHVSHTLQEYKDMFIKYGIKMDENFSVQPSCTLPNFYIG